jgi:hypothetical protein
MKAMHVHKLELQNILKVILHKKRKTNATMENNKSH